MDPSNVSRGQSWEQSLEQLTDDELVLRFNAGCEDAFTILVSRNEIMIRSQAGRLRGTSGATPIDADDLAQEGLFGLYLAARRYDAAFGASFRTFAAVCVRNRMISTLRSGGTAPVTVELDNPENETTAIVEELGTELDPARLVMEQEEAKRLYLRLSHLLTDLEYTVLMGHLNGYAYKELSARLNISPKAVDNALQRVRRKLTGEFDPLS